MEDPINITTEIYHLKESPLYVTEKPYTMRYTTGGAVLATNVTREKHTVHIEDMRKDKHRYTLQQHGFTVADLDSSEMKYEDFDSHERITEIYLPELEKVLTRLFPEGEIDFVSYLIRKRDTSFPYSTGTPYTHGQPNIVAHIDATSADLTRQISRRHHNNHPSSSSSSSIHRSQYITLWKPLRGPLHDWPLALCDGHSVDRDRDLQPQDIVDREEVLENVHVYWREGHRWYWLSGQSEDEVLVFRQADTAEPGFGTPHCAVENPRAPGDALPRESIEVVAFVYGG